MKTPIYDFVKKYAESDVSRFHMPGHKGHGPLGVEALDITEIDGADVLYSADGIIAESENNATELFDSAHTFYSAEGSSLSIKAMLALACSKSKDRRPLILAARNVHKAFVYAAALLDFDIEWVYPNEPTHLCTCMLTAGDVEAAILCADRLPTALYLTSPDYLGGIADIESISKVCKRHGVLLLVDNAHGAYLNFLESSLHPISLGADMCCDSAHKTLPVLTGGAYLHISKNSDTALLTLARNTLSVFASTSPSYLILESLDLCNAYIADGYREKLQATVRKVAEIKKHLSSLDISVLDSEPLKITVSPRSVGYTGNELANYLRNNKIECEFADGEYVVLMVSTSNTDADLDRLVGALEKLPKKSPLEPCVSFAPEKHEARMRVREAVFAPREVIPASTSAGRILASPTVSCPPAVPIVVSGEVITERDVEVFARYGITEVEVVKF